MGEWALILVVSFHQVRSIFVHGRRWQCTSDRLQLHLAYCSRRPPGCKPNGHRTPNHTKPGPKNHTSCSRPLHCSGHPDRIKAFARITPRSGFPPGSSALTDLVPDRPLEATASRKQQTVFALTASERDNHMSEQARAKTFMEELDDWTNASVIVPLTRACEERSEKAYHEAAEAVEKAIRSKVLESYRNGQAAGKKPAGKRSR